ncbi:salt tolerance receptor-like cytoplasmic kinase 1 [Typha latifolia]|uniref:salt tolerance receptor-like cytoplasmic kinase 1 n=1 Tax=Typha latifolia TaxID=4733 RepID=UPI003C2E0DBB
MLLRYNIFCCGGGGGGGCRGDPDDSDSNPPNARVADEPKSEASKDSVRQFGWSEIESLTSGFTSAVIGEGGFSTVYLARLPGSPSSSLAAVKLHRSSERLHRVFRQELDVLLRVRHPNIVRLLGFCDEREEGVLVLEFVPKGNLYDKLHDGGRVVIPWARRILIALQLAKALEYLHEMLDLQVIHGDVKASNVLLDERMDAKLCDFGSARMGFSAAVQPRSAQAMLGSPGYMDPHYIRSGMVTKKNDVYSFGVLLLELITGVEAFCSEKGQLLTAVLRPRLRESAVDVDGLVDPKLGGLFQRAEAEAMAEMAATCIRENPSLRPSMPEVVRVMREKLSSSISAVGARSNGAKCHL